jgi:hypothetical protein
MHVHLLDPSVSVAGEGDVSLHEQQRGARGRTIYLDLAAILSVVALPPSLYKGGSRMTISLAN